MFKISSQVKLPGFVKVYGIGKAYLSGQAYAGVTCSGLVLCSFSQLYSTWVVPQRIPTHPWLWHPHPVGLLLHLLLLLHLRQDAAVVLGALPW